MHIKSGNVDTGAAVLTIAACYFFANGQWICGSICVLAIICGKAES
jgi:hypothetical protein